jgi:hypothetical protein
VDVDLDEGAGQLLLFPRRGLLARTQTHDHVLPANRLAWPDRHVLDDPVALVEDAEHRHALGHRRHSALPRRGDRNVLVRRSRCVFLLRPLAASGKRKRDQKRSRKFPHDYSGIQGS